MPLSVVLLPPFSMPPRSDAFFSCEHATRGDKNADAAAKVAVVTNVRRLMGKECKEFIVQ